MTKDPTYPLTRKEIKEYKEKIKKIQSTGYKKSIIKYGNKLGENLGDALRDNLPIIRPVVVERSAKLWINPKTRNKIINLIDSGELTYVELHDFATSVSNSIKSLAGGSFETLICDSLNHIFKKEKVVLHAETKGKYRELLNKKLTNSKHKTTGVKPDIDIIVYDTKSDKILVVISCKTTFRERLMQTISWKNYFLSFNDPDIKKIKVFVVTAWETLEDKTIRKRTSVLDGVYVTNKNVKVGGNIKKFDSIYKDIKKLAKNQSK